MFPVNTKYKVLFPQSFWLLAWILAVWTLGVIGITVLGWPFGFEVGERAWQSATAAGMVFLFLLGVFTWAIDSLEALVLTLVLIALLVAGIHFEITFLSGLITGCAAGGVALVSSFVVFDE